MQLVMTLLCRNEEDIVGSMVEFHLARGVDLILATDNGSCDDTVAILETFQRQGRLRLLHEPAHTHDQAVWVSRMARMAARDHQADWVIHADADEFWWPRGGDLKAELAAIPAKVKALVVSRTNFLPPASRASGRLPFYRKQMIRERLSLNALGRPLPGKICHRGRARAQVSDGNHQVRFASHPVRAAAAEGIEILHFPVRSYRQLERKIREGAEALERNARIDPVVGLTWRRLYADHLLPGTLRAYYNSLRPGAPELASRVRSGELLEDRRLLDALEGEPPPVRSPARARARRRREP